MFTFRTICLVQILTCHPSLSFLPATKQHYPNHHQQQQQRFETRIHLSKQNEINDQSNISPNPTLDNEHNPSTSTSTSNDDELAFFDEAIIHVRGGSGGQGASTYKQGLRKSDGIPDGGNGGSGGDVILTTDNQMNTLAGLTLGWRPNSFGGSGASYKQSASQMGNSLDNKMKSFRAGNGKDGGRRFDNGGNGDNVEIRVPPGTIVQEEIELTDEDGTVVDKHLIDLGELTTDRPVLVVANGGRGGEGSGVTRKAAAKGKTRGRNPPGAGERKRIRLTLKIVADVALVGVPNVGKSTFLASVTRAKPKIANYPFTTVIPNLGVWVPPEFDYTSSTPSSDLKSGSGSTGLVLCDVPGLVAGAAEGVGLGHAFLRHVERCHVILHLIDATAINAVDDFTMLNRELERYGSGQLAEMPQVVVVNKIDALGGEEEREELRDRLKGVMEHSRLMWISARDKDGVDDLMARMAKFLGVVKETKAQVVE